MQDRTSDRMPLKISIRTSIFHGRHSVVEDRSKPFDSLAYRRRGFRTGPFIRVTGFDGILANVDPIIETTQFSQEPDHPGLAISKVLVNYTLGCDGRQSTAPKITDPIAESGGFTA